MTCQTALIVVALAGAIFLAVGIYAQFHLTKWMANYDTKNKGPKE